MTTQPKAKTSTMRFAVAALVLLAGVFVTGTLANNGTPYFWGFLIVAAGGALAYDAGRHDGRRQAGQS